MIKMYKHGLKCLQLIALICGITLLSTAAHAQSAPSATGIVKDTLGVPIAGATVKAENKLTGKAVNATTDNNGVFNLANLQTGGNYSFTFTFIGFETKTLTGYEASAGNKISLSVTLKESATSLTQVVVTGYGTSKRADLTGAVTSVQAEDFNRGVISSPSQLLQYHNQFVIDALYATFNILKGGYMHHLYA